MSGDSDGGPPSGDDGTRSASSSERAGTVTERRWPGGRAAVAQSGGPDGPVWDVTPRFSRTGDPPPAEDLREAFTEWESVDDHANVATLRDWRVDDGPRVTVPAPEYGTLRRVPDDEATVLWVDEALAIGRDLCRAAAHAHDAGVVHRALDPATVHLRAGEDRRFRAAVADWGIGARLCDHPDAIRARRVHYAAPEQIARDGNPDERTDCYQIGAILSELLTGRTPVDGDRYVAGFGTDERVPPSERVEALPDAVDEAVGRALRTDPSDRYRSVAAFADAMAALDVPTSLRAAGLTATWPASRGGPAQRGPRASQSGPEIRPDTAWETRANEPVAAAPIVAHDTLYVGGEDGTVTAMHPVTGDVRWEHEFDDAGAAAPAAGGGMVVVAHGRGIAALDPLTGERRWQRDIDADCAPVVDGGVAYVADRTDGSVAALDVATGETNWRAATEALLCTAPAVADGCVVVGSVDEGLLAFDAADGDERWRFGTESRIAGPPALRDGTAFLAEDAGAAYAVDAESGAYQWEAALDGKPCGGPAVADETVYLATARRGDARLRAFDAASGGPRWTCEVGETLTAAPAGWTDLLLAPGENGVHGVDAETGRQRWHVDLGGEVGVAPGLARRGEESVAYVGRGYLVAALAGASL